MKISYAEMVEALDDSNPKEFVEQSGLDKEALAWLALRNGQIAEERGHDVQGAGKYGFLVGLETGWRLARYVMDKEENDVGSA